MVGILEMNTKKSYLAHVKNWWKLEGKIELIFCALSLPFFFFYEWQGNRRAVAICFWIMAVYSLIKLFVFKRQQLFLLAITLILTYIGWVMFWGHAQL
jgi:hypothetical protein